MYLLLCTEALWIPQTISRPTLASIIFTKPKAGEGKTSLLEEYENLKVLKPHNFFFLVSCRSPRNHRTRGTVYRCSNLYVNGWGSAATRKGGERNQRRNSNNKMMKIILWSTNGAKLTANKIYQTKIKSNEGRGGSAKMCVLAESCARYIYRRRIVYRRVHVPQYTRTHTCIY